MLRPRTKHQRSLALLCIGCTAAVWWASNHFHYYGRKERSWGDTLQRVGRRAPVHPNLMFLGIDNSVESASDLDLATSPELQAMRAGFPWPRWVYGAITERLVEAGAKVVAFDVLLTAEKEGDSALQARFEKYAGHVVIGSNLADKELDEQREPGGTVSFIPRHILPSPSVVPRDAGGQSISGFVNFRADWDGVVRRTNYRTTVFEYIGKPAPPGEPELLSLAARSAVKAGFGLHVPATREPIMIRFPLFARLRPRSIHQIFVDRMWDSPTFQHGEIFRDKVVFVGPFGNWVKDELATPFGNTLGPVVHMSALNAALQNDFLHEPSRREDTILIVLGGLVAWLLGSVIVNPLVRVALLVGAGAGYASGAYFAFNFTGWLPPLLSPLLALGASGFSSSVYEQVRDRLQKAKMRKTFERYVSRDVVKELLDNPESYLNTVGGARKKVSVLFSDVRGFTTLTESGDAQTLVKQLNEYFDAMVNIVFKNNGTLDKFIGDAVMAQWGGIYTAGEKTDACRAVHTALQMQRALADMNPKWKQRGMLELKFGIGINHGEAIVGNLGCEAKMEVSLIGDAVNTASRLEGLTKQYHVELLIGESVEQFVREDFIIRTVGRSQPKGKTKPLEIFTVLGERAPGISEPGWLAIYEKGIDLYRAGEFAPAAECFTQVLRDVPDDWLAADYLDDCCEFLVKPPPPGWNAVNVEKTK